MSTDNVKTRYGEPYTAFWLKLVPKFLSPVSFGVGWSPEEPDIEGTHFSSAHINSQISKEVFIALIAVSSGFALIIFVLVLSICRSKSSGTP